MRKVLALTAAAALAAGMPACGFSKSNEKQVRDTLNTFYGAVANDDGITACNLLTRAERARVTTPSTGPCGRLTLQAVRKTGVTQVPKVSNVDVSGRKATATLQTPRGTRRVHLDKEKGKDWKISRL